ncbi:hypothetical protein [Methylobacterium nodulans]|uniref:Uncharacterized protein n=1 Tax=Methylobacterium nodulans (strain LMG 21967 / CNCM I-2342 / ORS 2060) TaxID=460265 RepID=B8INI7_METNO|nr:hypothetical protein [Methylobacterium nodulans]ACL56513.1 conserved hypothetical protein [Methylobacterium nodulans ORS 2060]
MIDHERRLLSKAAQTAEGRISVKRDPDRSWPGDHSRLCALENDGHLRFVGEQAGPHIGGTFAIWQITERGRAALQVKEAQMRTPTRDAVPFGAGAPQR